MKTVRWGLLSTANINRRLIPAIRASQRGELVAVASRTQASADAYAQKWDIPQAFGSYQAMLASGAVDAVYISLPNHLHAEWSIQAMRAGVAVLCEKPFALTLAEVDEMIAVHEETGVPLAEAFMYLHHPQTKIARDWVQSGRLGTISLVRGTFDFAMSNPDGNIRMDPALGGGCLWDVGVYPMSFAQFVMGGKPAWVLGTQWVGPTGVDETFAGQMGYTQGAVAQGAVAQGAVAQGAIAQIASSFRTPYHTFFEIVGTEGRLHLTRPFTGLDGDDRSFTFTNKNGISEELPVPEVELYSGEVEDMHAALLDQTPNALSLTETRNHIQTVLALYESAKTGKIVYLP
ncbi:MAG: Gfo/Idh/MocA family oxidoreductase [Anaerolineales bacterium]|nr:Gfo/Idh/MocA family oxidoreductase [Anaerolineales bacterium]